MSKKIEDRICSAVFFSIGTFILINIPKYIGNKKTDILGPKFLPYVIACGLMALSVLLFTTTFFSAEYKKEGNATNSNIWKDEIRVLLFIIFVILSIIIMDKFGFILGALCFTTSTMLILKNKKISWYAITYGVVGVLYLFFTFVMRIDLP